MTSTAVIPAALVEACPSPTAEAAVGPRSHEGGTFKLDDWTASVRYAVDGIFCRVVTTLTPDRPATGGAKPGHAPILFTVLLAPGERHTVAMARPRQTPAPAALEIAHTADALVVAVVGPAMD